MELRIKGLAIFICTLPITYHSTLFNRLRAQAPSSLTPTPTSLSLWTPLLLNRINKFASERKWEQCNGCELGKQRGRTS